MPTSPKITDPFPDKMTIGDKYRPAMEITDQAKADAYFERCVEHCIRASEGEPRTREEAERIERSNLGYFAGYYSSETRAQVERLYHCSHPIFGSIAANGSPTPQEAFDAGKKIGEAS